MKFIKKEYLILLYIFWVIFGILLWFFVIESMFFVGATSIVSTFLTAVSGEIPRVLAWCLLLYGPIFLCLLVCSYFLANFKKKFILFAILIAVDWIMILFMIMIKLFVLKYTFLIDFDWAGLVVNGILDLILLHFYKKAA